jgi:hypothetical protein
MTPKIIGTIKSVAPAICANLQIMDWCIQQNRRLPGVYRQATLRPKSAFSYIYRLPLLTILLPQNAKSPLNQRALHILISFTIGGSDGTRSLTCIKSVVVFLPKFVVKSPLSNPWTHLISYSIGKMPMSIDLPWCCQLCTLLLDIILGEDVVL